MTQFRVFKANGSEVVDLIECSKNMLSIKRKLLSSTISRSNISERAMIMLYREPL